MAVSVAIRGGRRRAPRPALAVLLSMLALVLSASAPAAAQRPPGTDAGDGAGAPAAGRDAGLRALVAFVPAGPGGSAGLLRDLAGMGFAVGLTSPTVGGYSPEQMALDISQGARISGAAYGDLPGGLGLRPTGGGGGRIQGWRGALGRARDAAGTVKPGLLATTIERAGGTSAYTSSRYRLRELPPPAQLGRGLERSVTPLVRPGKDELAIAAADRRGRVSRISVARPGTLAERALRLSRSSPFVVARLPLGAEGRAALSELVAGTGDRALLYVLEDPPSRLELLATGVRAPGYGGVLTSDTTRRDGLVAAPDVAPTILEQLGIAVPDAMRAAAVGSTPGDVGELTRLDERLADVVSRRDAALTWLLFAWIALVAGLTLAARRRGLRAGLRIGFLGALWLPAVALLTAALRPSEAVEIVILAASAIALGAATDRALPWPTGPVLPAATVFCLHAVDLAAGSPLIAASLAGPNPFGGARFFGVGNELEIILSLIVLLGAAAGLALVPAHRAKLVPRGFAAACAVGAVVLGAGQLGADVGGVVTLAAGGAAAVLAALPRRPGRRAVAAAVAAPVVGLACLAAIDLATGGGAHFTSEVIEGDDPGELIDTLRRRLDLSASGLEQRGKAVAVALALGALAATVACRRRLLAPLAAAGDVAARALRAGLAGALVATVVGALANDSGPTILLTGTFLLLLALGYAGAPPIAPGGARSNTLARCA